MKCTRCGTEGSPGAIFCLNCGMALPKDAAQAAPTSAKTMVLPSEPVPAEADNDSGRTMVLDNVKGSQTASANSGGETAVMPSNSSAGAATQFISREAMAAALAQLKSGPKDQPPTQPQSGPPAKDTSAETKVEQVKANPPEAAIEESVKTELVIEPVMTEPVSKPAKTEPIVEPPAAAKETKVEEPVAAPVQDLTPRPKVEPVVPAVSASANANFEGTRAKLREVEADLLSYEQKLADSEQRKSTLQGALSQALSQLKSLSNSDSQSQQELDYENLYKLVIDLATSPRDIELISSLARRGSALKRLFEIHRSAMDAVSGITKTLDSVAK